MNREIKFRQLVITISPSGDNSNMHTKEGGLVWHYFGLVDNAWVSPVGIHYPIMQFTGLLDKNGKEIYENDIVKLLCSTNKKHHFNGKIVFEGHKFEVEYASKYTKMHTWVGMHDCFDYLEIIGNVFENPELLNN